MNLKDIENFKNMAIKGELLLKGWHLSETGMDILKDGLEETSAFAIMEKALDFDLRDIAAPFLSDEIQKGKVDSLSGPCILQIQKLKNVAAPKYEISHSRQRLLRLLLTDGHAYINCLQWDSWPLVTLDTPPGSKLFIKHGKVPIQNGFLLLKANQYLFLDGQVAPMIEKWQLAKQFASHQRRGQGSEEGPPPWIPFGKSINYNASKVPSGNFRSLDTEVKKEEKEDAVFKQQRMANIAEISRSKEGKRKVFGGGKDYGASENVLDLTSGSHMQDRKYFSDNADVPKTSNQPQVLKQTGKKTSVETADYQGKSYDFENKNLLYKHPENYHYKNPNNFQQHRDTNQHMENIKFGRSGNNLQGPLFYRNPSTDFRQRENRSDNSSLYSNSNSGYSKFQEKGNRSNENSIHQTMYGNLPINTQNTQDRQNYSRSSNSFKGENRFNHNVGHCNIPANRRGVSRRDEMVSHSDLLLETFTDGHFPVSEPNQERMHFSGVLEFRRGGNRPFIHRNDENYQDRQRERPPRQGHRPSSRLYQPPRQRRG